MDRTVRERFARIAETATRVEEEADRARWDSALAHAVTLHSDAVFIVDWLRGQAEYHFSAACTRRRRTRSRSRRSAIPTRATSPAPRTACRPFGRSEERRVGKECRSRWSP